MPTLHASKKTDFGLLPKAQTNNCHWHQSRSAPPPLHHSSVNHWLEMVSLNIRTHQCRVTRLVPIKGVIVALFTSPTARVFDAWRI